MSSLPPPKPKRVEVDGYYKNYADYNQTLRTWLLSYGVGAPVLFVSQEHVVTILKQSSWGVVPVVLFFLGVGAQIGIALLNKTIALAQLPAKGG